MSATWVVAGNTTDLIEPISTTLMNFVAGKWAETNPVAAQIRFLQDWYDGYGSYQIHFRESDTPVTAQTLGWRYRSYDDYVMVHIFVRRNVPEEPPERGNIVRELQRIISQNRDTLLAGTTTGFTDAYTNRFVNITTPGKRNTQMQIVQINDEILTNAVTTVWHSIMRVRIHYWKVDTSSP